MDFLEIRRKAKERAAARAAAARAQAGGAPSPAAEPPAHPALALEPLPLPPAEPAEGPAPGQPRPPPAAWSPPPLDPLPEAPAGAGPWAVPAEPAEAPAEPPAPGGARDEAAAAEAAAETARIEAELEARLRDMPAAADARFLTWRPRGGAVPDVAPVAPDEPEAAPAGRGAGDAARAAPADPLDEFFYREDEPGPGLGALAAPAEAAAPLVEVVPRIEYLTFQLGDEAYGVLIEQVREVMRSPPITEVPRAPADVLGVITVRGEVVAVFDPRARLGLPRGAGAGGGRIIIVDDGAGPCGLLVDGVASVVRLPRGSIEPRPQGIGGAAADCLEGIGRDRDRLFTVLSVAALLKPARRAEGRA